MDDVELGHDRAAAPGVATPREPVVVLFDPRRGWDRLLSGPPWWVVLRVVCLLAGATALLLRPAFSLVPGLGEATVLAWTFVGPMAVWVLARLLRPHPPGTGFERRCRHVVAAVTGAYGTGVLVLISGVPGSSDQTWLQVVFALWFLGALAVAPVGAAWGLVALLVRAARSV